MKFGSYSESLIIKVKLESPDIMTFVYYGEDDWLDGEFVRLVKGLER